MKKRIITGIGIAIVAVPLVILGSWWSIGLFTVVAVCSMWELLKTKHDQKWPISVYITTFIFATLITFWPFFSGLYEGTIDAFEIPYPFLVKENFFCIIAFLLAILTCEFTSHNFSIMDAFYIFTMTLFICLACQGLMFIRLSFGIVGIAYIVLISLVCDSFAHIFGCKFGKKKLAPLISPHKTWVGAICGVIGSTLFGVLFYAIFPVYESQYGWVLNLVISFCLAIGAVCGDLIFSSIKRQVGIKDFSEIFPGHGGMLDRFDSTLFNSLLFVVLYFALVEGLKMFI